MIDARAVLKSVFLDTCIENWWGIKNQICNCSQWYLLWAYYAMKMKTFSRNKKNLRGDDSFHVCCDVYQLSYESTEEESAKTLTRTISKTRTKLRDFFFIFFFLLHSIFQQIYSDHLLWKQVWITVKTCYTINFIFIFFCNFPTLILVAFGNIFCQLSKQAQKRQFLRFCSRNFSYHILLTFLIYWYHMVQTMSFKSHLSTFQVEECS